MEDNQDQMNSTQHEQPTPGANKELDDLFDSTKVKTATIKDMFNSEFGKQNPTSVLDSMLKGVEDSKVNSSKELEVALRSLTPAEREYGIMHELSFRNPKEIEKLKAAYKKAYEFTFGRKIKAIWNLLFSKVTPELFAYVVNQAIESKEFEEPLDPLMNPLGSYNNQSFSNAIDITQRPLEWASPTTDIEHLKELEAAGIQLTAKQKEYIEKFGNKKAEPDSTRMANDLDKSIEKLVAPKIVKTIRMSSTKKRTTKKAVEPTKKTVPATKRSPKKTK